MLWQLKVRVGHSHSREHDVLIPDTTTPRPDQPRSEPSKLHPVVDGILLADAVAWFTAGGCLWWRRSGGPRG